ncbi:MEDS domain-containing protein [Spirillospora albida]|uniref:MEDS domain-containing protein n=1 Tax=Spirillospora albida TaxID=58123 RepID=UPI0004C22440|nr:MEDS domain-containing protein [Spirillospora albida]
MDTLWSVRRPVSDLRPGDHACLAYAGEDEFQHVVGAYVRGGLRAREAVLYLTGDAAAAVPGVPPRAAHRLLTVIAADEGPRARLDPEAVRDALAAEVARADRHGVRAVRIIADLTWALRRPDGLEVLLACEEHLERITAPSTRVTAICPLDRRRCDAADLEALRARHAVRAAPDPEFEDPVLTIVRTFQPAGLSLSGELDASRHAVLDQALAILPAGRDIHLDMAGLGFIDLGAINLLADVAGRAGTGSVVLDRMAPEMRAVLDTVGWARLPGLRVGAPA